MILKDAPTILIALLLYLLLVNDDALAECAQRICLHILHQNVDNFNYKIPHIGNLMYTRGVSPISQTLTRNSTTPTFITSDGRCLPGDWSARIFRYLSNGRQSGLDLRGPLNTMEQCEDKWLKLMQQKVGHCNPLEGTRLIPQSNNILSLHSKMQSIINKPTPEGGQYLRSPQLVSFEEINCNLEESLKTRYSTLFDGHRKKKKPFRIGRCFNSSGYRTIEEWSVDPQSKFLCDIVLELIHFVVVDKHMPAYVTDYYENLIIPELEVAFILMDHYDPKGLIKLPLASPYSDGISEVYNYPNLAGPYQSNAYFEGTKMLLKNL